MTATHNARRLALVGIVALVAALFPLSGAFAQDTDGNALNLSGSDNVATAIAWSQVTYTPLGEAGPDNAVTEVLLGRDDLFADNLASGARQGTAAADDNGAPLLLTPGDSLDADTLAEIDRVTGDDATVTILGGTDAVSGDVETELTDAGYTVQRLSGETRIETAIAIAEDNSDANTVLVVRAFPGDTGDDTQAFADSLGAGAVAATNGWDILFTQTDVLTGNTETALTDGGYDQAYVVGGTAAISDEVLAAVTEIVPATERVSGPTRFDTAVELNSLRDETVGDGDIVILVDGQADDAWADGFAAANLSGLNNYPVVLSNQGDIPQATEDFLSSFDDDATTFANHFVGVELVCGTTVDTETCQAALNLINGNENGTVAPFPADAPPVDPIGPNETFTDAPELLSVDKGSNGIVTFTFDEAIPGIAPFEEDFRLYAPTGDPVDAIDLSVSGATVIARYTVGDVATSILAGVREGAVEDEQGLPNPAADFPLTATAVQVGELSPSLIAVDNYRFANDLLLTQQLVLVDFTFDDPAGAIFASVETGTVTAEDFYLVGANSALYQGDSTVAPAEATTEDDVTTVTVAFADDPTEVPATQLRRGFFQSAVGSTTLDEIVYAQPFGTTDGTTTDPDLVSVTREGTSDIFRFTFDEAVDDDAGSFFVAGFNVVAEDGTVYNASSAARSAAAGDGAAVVRAEFDTLPDGVFPVFSFVEEDTVLATDNTDSVNGGQSRPDSVTITAPTLDDPTPGDTEFPDLLSAERFVDEVTGNYAIELTFDDDATGLVGLIDISLYDANGVQFTLGAGNETTTADANVLRVESISSDQTDDEFEAAVTATVQTTSDALADTVTPEAQVDASTVSTE